MTNLRLGLLAGLVLGSMCAPAPSSAEVLYDQTTNAAVPNADSNQLNFAPSNLFGSTEELTVDDFEFPRGDTWVIDQVDVTGAFHGNPPAQVNVYILGEDLSNSEGVPIAFSQKGIAAAGGPNYVIPLKGARLLGGTYWLGVQQAGATSGGYWSWGTSTVRTGGSARHGTPFVNTPNCPVGVFNVRLDCYDGNSPDQVFRISGTDLTLKLGKPKLDKDEGTAELPVTVHGPGELNLHANAIATQEEEVTQTGTTEMLVKARGKARRKLNRSGSVRVNAAVTFTAAGGRSVTEDRVVKLAKRVG